MNKKGSAEWWFGPNSAWQQSGLSQAVLGTGGENKKEWELPFTMRQSVGLDEQTIIVIGGLVIAWIIFK